MNRGRHKNNKKYIISNIPNVKDKTIRQLVEYYYAMISAVYPVIIDHYGEQNTKYLLKSQIKLSGETSVYALINSMLRKSIGNHPNALSF